MHTTLQELLKRTPFKPFRLQLTNGESYTIRHPREVMLMKTRVVLAFPKTDRFAILDLPEITDVKPLPTKPKKK